MNYRPEVRVVDFVAGARTARGLAVVIDVFRAFSVAAYAHAWGARSIVPVASIDDARSRKAADPAAVLIGERHARKLPGFDCGNSPTELELMDIQGRTLIHTTHSGTQGLTSAVCADEVLTGALVNAAAIVRYIQWRQPALVTLVRMGHEATQRCAEDDLCADLLKRRLAGEEPDVLNVPDRLRSASSAAKFFDPACDWAPERDFELCTAVDRFDFILKLQPDGSLAALCVPATGLHTT